MEIKTLAQILADNQDSRPNEGVKQSVSKRPGKCALNKAASGKQLGRSKRKRSKSWEQNRATRDFVALDKQFDNNIDAAQNDTAQKNPAQPLSPDNKSKGKPRSRSKRQRPFHPGSVYQPKLTDTDTPENTALDPNCIKNLLTQVKAESDAVACTEDTQKDIIVASTDIDNLPDALKAYLKTPAQRQAEKEHIKANSRLRWLAFYYLSRREHSAEELRRKLLDKEQDPIKIQELLTEFAEKGYQSDYRTALMLIREGIRKGRGRVRIKHDFNKRRVDMPTNIDELIDMAMTDNEAFVDVLSDNDLVEGVDWLRLAVEARVKKYGRVIPTEPKEKARQLRFLQYRGFKPDVCFEAIRYNLDNLADRF